MNTIGRPLTIAHVTGEVGFSGGEVQLFLLAAGLSKCGHRNVILCPHRSRSAAESIRSAVDTGSLVPQRERKQTRAHQGISDRTPCLLALASLIPRKGIDVLVDALGLLRQRGAQPVLLLAGKEPQRNALERRVARQQLSDAVHFLGQRSDVPDLLQASDVVVVPSRREGLGVAALEAMAIGRPVVASAVGGLPEAVIHRKTGLLVPPDDPSALAGALSELIDNPAKREQLGRAGIQRVANVFSSKRMVRAYEDLCFEVVAERQCN